MGCDVDIDRTAALGAAANGFVRCCTDVCLSCFAELAASKPTISVCPFCNAIANAVLPQLSYVMSQSRHWIMVHNLVNNELLFLKALKTGLYQRQVHIYLTDT